MPVIREKQQIGAVQPGGVVPATGLETWARVAADMASQAFSTSHKISRVMTGAEADKAKALAEQVAIATDENGVPQMTAEQAQFSTRAAQHAYDTTLNQRYRQRLSVAMEARVAELATEHDGDPNGFQLAMSAAVEGMADHVPERFQAYWQDDAAAVGAKYGAQLGRQAAEDAQRAKASDFEVASGRANEAITSAILGGSPQDADAQIVMLETMGKELLDQGAVLPHVLAAALRDARAAKGVATIRAMGQGDDTHPAWGSMEYEAAATALAQGGTALDGYFPDEASRAAAQSQLTNLAARKRSEEIAAANALKAESEKVHLANGYSEATDANRELLDVQLGTTLEDWGTSNVAQNPETWAQIQEAGFLSKSLLGAFLAASRPGNMDPAQREQVFRIWRTLHDGVAPDGTRTHLADDIPANVTERFMMTTAFMEFGGDSFEQADINAQDVMKQGFDAGRIVTTMTGYAEPMGGGAWNEASIHDQMAAFVDAHLEYQLESVIANEDSKMAAVWFAKLMSTDQMSADDALAMVTTQFKNRYAETEAMFDPVLGVLNRSWAAPERVYAVSTDPYGVLGQIGKSMALSPLGYLTLSKEEIAERSRPWFDRWAEGKVRAALPDGLAADFAGYELTPGDSYRLEAIGTDRARPQYRVYAPNSNGTWTRLPLVLDPAAAHETEINRLRGVTSTSENLAAQDEMSRHFAETPEQPPAPGTPAPAIPPGLMR